MRLIDFSVVRYALVGGLNTLIGLLVIYAGLWLFGLGDVAANALGYCIGFLVSFSLNKRWTFRHDGARLPALLRFAAVIASAWLTNLGIVLLLIGAGLDNYLAQAAGVLPYAIVGYLGSRFLAFAPPSQGGSAQGAEV